MEPDSPRKLCQCMAWVMGSLSLDSTPDISGWRRNYDFLVSKSLKLYFRGDIKIASVDGYGTDVYVYLQRLSHLAQENLPVYNAVSSAKLRNSATQVNDWTDLGNMQ